MFFLSQGDAHFMHNTFAKTLRMVAAEHIVTSLSHRIAQITLRLLHSYEIY